MKFRLLLISLLALAFAATVLAQDEISVGDTVSDEANDEIVEYTIELEQGQMIEVSLQSDDFDTYLEVLNADGDVVAENDDVDFPDTNSFVEYTVDETGTYTIRIKAFAGDPDGEYELEVASAGRDEVDEPEDDSDENDNDRASSSADVDLVYDEEFEFDVDGEDDLVVTFFGQSGDVVTILTRSDAEQNMRIFLNGPDGDTVRANEEYNYGDAVLVRVPLVETGAYTIRLEETDGAELDDEIEIEVLQTELLDLDQGQQFTLVEASVGMDYMFFEAREDSVYQITVNLDEDIDSTLDIDVMQESDTYSASAVASFRGVENATFSFEASEDGIVIIELDYWGYGNDEIEVTISVEEE